MRVMTCVSPHTSTCTVVWLPLAKQYGTLRSWQHHAVRHAPSRTTCHVIQQASHKHHATAIVITSDAWFDGMQQVHAPRLRSRRDGRIAVIGSAVRWQGRACFGVDVIVSLRPASVGPARSSTLLHWGTGNQGAFVATRQLFTDGSYVRALKPVVRIRCV
jgi:hypothetical protein